MVHYRTTFGLAGYLFIGTAAVLTPVMMPFIADEFVAAGLTLAAIGLIFPARSVGGILGNLLSGVASDMVGRWRLVWISALFLAAALALAAVAKLWMIFMFGFVLIGAAQGSLATGINAMVADANRGSRARSLNILHGVYGAGAAISPLIFGFLIDRGLQWRWALAGTGLIWLSYGLAARVYGRHEAPDAHQTEAQKLDLGMLRRLPFLALFLIAFIYNAIAYSLLGWIAVFMQQMNDSSLLFSVSLISLFYVALTLGRFICAAFAERIGYATTLLILSIGVTVTYPLVVFGANAGWMAAGVFLTGLSVSGLFPTAMAFGARLYTAQTGTVSGTLNSALTLGGMAPPFWTGIIAAFWGFQMALGLNWLMALPLILLALYLGRVEARDADVPAAGNVLQKSAVTIQVDRR